MMVPLHQCNLVWQSSTWLWDQVAPSRILSVTLIPLFPSATKPLITKANESPNSINSPSRPQPKWTQDTAFHLLWCTEQAPIWLPASVLPLLISSCHWECEGKSWPPYSSASTLPWLPTEPWCEVDSWSFACKMKRMMLHWMVVRIKWHKVNETICLSEKKQI